jgi:hypothetical protein
MKKNDNKGELKKLYLIIGLSFVFLLIVGLGAYMFSQNEGAVAGKAVEEKIGSGYASSHEGGLVPAPWITSPNNWFIYYIYMYDFDEYNSELDTTEDYIVSSGYQIYTEVDQCELGNDPSYYCVSCNNGKGKEMTGYYCPKKKVPNGWHMEGSFEKASIGKDNHLCVKKEKLSLECKSAWYGWEVFRTSSKNTETYIRQTYGTKKYINAKKPNEDVTLSSEPASLYIIKGPNKENVLSTLIRAVDMRACTKGDKITYYPEDNPNSFLCDYDISSKTYKQESLFPITDEEFEKMKSVNEKNPVSERIPNDKFNNEGYTWKKCTSEKKGTLSSDSKKVCDGTVWQDNAAAVTVAPKSDAVSAPAELPCLAGWWYVLPDGITIKGPYTAPGTTTEGDTKPWCATKVKTVKGHIVGSLFKLSEWKYCEKDERTGRNIGSDGCIPDWYYVSAGKLYGPYNGCSEIESAGKPWCVTKGVNLDLYYGGKKYGTDWKYS